jgi:hypothetical protein
MQAQTRVGLIVIGLLAVVLVAMVGQARAETQEVCTTPDVEAAQGQVVVCTLRNAYAYGPVDVVQLEILDGAGRVAISTPGPVVLPPLSSQTLAHIVTLQDVFTFSCRVTVLEPLPGYVRLAISRDSTPGYPAQCNPF